MPATVNGLKIALKQPTEPFKDGHDICLKAVFQNVGNKPLSLTFWWNIFIRVTDKAGKLVKAGPGPELPCGVKEDITKLAPGEVYEKDQMLGCTQPAGLKLKVGWDYDLPAGKYKVVMVFEYPPAHGYSDNDAPDAWKGKIEADPVEIEVLHKPPKKKGLFRKS